MMPHNFNRGDNYLDTRRFTHPKAEKWSCPICGDLLPVYYHSVERGWRHPDIWQFLRQNYFTLVFDLDRGSVKHIGDGRDLRCFESYLENLTTEQLQAIVAIAMDIHEVYIQVAMATVPEPGTRSSPIRVFSMNSYISCVKNL